MDSACVYDEKAVIHELTQGRTMAQQLRANLHSPQTRDICIQKILSSYNNALFSLQSGHSTSLLESSISFGCPGSEEFVFGQPFSGQQRENIISKKRKRSTTWEDQVRACDENGFEGDNDDGYNWRKYGQKDIQGAKFPRSYYKCSYRNIQKCFATKQVQRREKNPRVFDIAYKGKHTCNQGAQSASPPPPPSPPSPEKHEITPTNHQLSPPPSPCEMLSTLRANLSLNTSDLDGDGDTIPSLFSFPSTSSGLLEDYHQFDFPNYHDDELLPIYSPSFISPVTSESDIFSEWGSSQSLDFLADVDPDFEFSTLF